MTSQRKEMVSTGGVIRGLYTGGTLAAEAAGLLAAIWALRRIRNITMA